MARKGGTLKFIGATAAGAIIGALAIRAFDKHILKGDDKEPEQLAAAPGPQQQQPMGMMGMGAPVMPVFLPSSPFMAGPPMSVPPPPTLGAPPTAAPPVPQEERDILDEIEEEWAD